jgi:hypothetical protein
MPKFEKFDSKKHIAGLADAAMKSQAEELIREGRMPSLDQVVAAIERGKGQISRADTGCTSTHQECRGMTRSKN